MKQSLVIAAAAALSGCMGAPAPRDSAPAMITATHTVQTEPHALEILSLIPTSIPNACGVAWDTMQPRQQSEWSKEEFAKACGEADYVVRCANGIIELDAGGKTCAAHGGTLEYLKWVDA